MTEKHTHWKKTFNKEYLGAHDLEEGQELKLEIKSVVVKPVTGPTGQTDNANVAIFTDSKIKPMILNATACKQITRFSGSPYIENWGGVAIQVYVQQGVQAFGETVDALRIRDMQPRLEKPVLNPSSPKWPDAVNSMVASVDQAAQITIIRKHYELSDDDLDSLVTEAQRISEGPENEAQIL